MCITLLVAVCARLRLVYVGHHWNVLIALIPCSDSTAEDFRSVQGVSRVNWVVVIGSSYWTVLCTVISRLSTSLESPSEVLSEGEVALVGVQVSDVAFLIWIWCSCSVTWGQLDFVIPWTMGILTAILWWYFLDLTLLDDASLWEFRHERTVYFLIQLVSPTCWLLARFPLVSKDCNGLIYLSIVA